MAGRHRQAQLQIVLVGRSRVGKSMSGNTILGREEFKIGLSHSPETKVCQSERGEIDGQPVVVIDSPGLFTPDRSDQSVMEEINKFLSRSSPVLFLVVIRVDQILLKEYKLVEVIQKSFGREADDVTMALFTRGDDLKAMGQSVDEFIGENPGLHEIIKKCRGGYHIFDNREEGRAQVHELMQKVNSTVQRNGSKSIDQMSQGGTGHLVAIGGIICAVGAIAAVLIGLQRI